MNMFVFEVEKEGEPPGGMKEEMLMGMRQEMGQYLLPTPWNELRSQRCLDPSLLLTQPLRFPFIAQAPSSADPSGACGAPPVI